MTQFMKGNVMANRSSGLDSLLDALRQSGIDMDGFGGAKGGPKEVDYEEVEGDDEGASRSTSGGNGGRGNSPHIDLNLSFFENMRAPSKPALIIGIVVVLLILAGCYWWFHPPINIHSVDMWVWIGIIMIILFLFFRAKSKARQTGTATVEASKSKAKTLKIVSYIPLAVIAVGILGAVFSLSIIPGNAEKYASVLKTDTLEFAQDIKEVNYNEIPVIDRDSAILLGNREMGSIPEYVSQFEVSSLYSQINYQGAPVRVSPLNYADLFKWFTNREGGIPAYALVNMTTQDAEIVRLGDEPIHYSTSEPLVRNIDRHVQLKYPFYIFDEKSFEIDEDGHPWWICPVRTYTIGLFGGETIDRVVLCDATTGECQDLALEECPQWVDRVFPAELLIKQYNWYGAYNNGWLNSFLGQEGVVRTTPGTDGTLGYNYIAKDDDVWVYTGVTSATGDKSIIGFVLVNQRTQESHFYSVSGATEDSAMESAEGQVQNLRYTSTFPLLINVANQPTYFMALKDGAGLVKKFAMIDVQRYQNVAVGDTVADTQKAYEALLATNGVSADAAGSVDVVQKTGVIRSMAQAVIESNSHFYVTIEGDDGQIYDFALPGLLDIVGYKEGDTITFTYLEGTGANPAYEIVDGEGDETATGLPEDTNSANVLDPNASTVTEPGTSGAAGAATA